MKSNAEILKQHKRDYRASQIGLARQRSNSERCDAFYDGDYMNYRANIYLDDVRIDGVQFNKVRPYVNAVHGFMIQNRREANFYPRLPQSEQYDAYTQQAGSVKDYVRAKAGAKMVESEGDLRLLVRGISATVTGMSYDIGQAASDPYGEIIMDDISNEVYWDDNARRKNLSDRRFDGYRKSYDLDEAKVLFGTDDEDNYTEVGSGGEDINAWQTDPNNAPYSYPYKYDWADKRNSRVWVHFYQWKETETFYRADNPLSALDNPMALQAGIQVMQELEQEINDDDPVFKFDHTADIIIFDSAAKTKLADAFEEYFEPYEFNAVVYYKAILSGEKVFDAFRAQSQSGFEIKFKTGIWSNSQGIWTGMVNPMMEPTEYFNKGMTKLMYLIAKNNNGTWGVEDGAIDDVRQFEDNINTPNKVLKLNAGGLAKVQNLSQQFSPNGYDSLIQLSDQAITDASCIDPSFLGSSENKMQTAQLHRQLVKQVMSTLAPFFDAREHYQEDQARLLLDFMRVFAENNRGRMLRITGDDGSHGLLAITEEPWTADWDVEIEEAPESDEERLDTADYLKDMGDTLTAAQNPANVVFYAESVNYMRLPSDVKQRLSQALTPPDDPRLAQLQQQIDGLQSALTQAQAAKLGADTQLVQAKTAGEAAKMHKLAADIDKTNSDTAQTIIENSIIKQVPADTIHVTA